MPSVAEPLESVLHSIANMNRSAAVGTRVRARPKWAEEGESSSRYFIASRTNEGRISGALSSAWRMAPLSQVSAIFVARGLLFNSSLFSAEPTDPGEQNFLFQHLESTLPDKASSSCDCPLSEDELLAAVLGMAIGKALGLDSLPLEFYLSFWHLLAPDLLTILNFSFREGHFPISLRSGIITLLLKKGDRLNPANWRPITLLKVDVCGPSS